jgi:hypothetical protein
MKEEEERKKEKKKACLQEGRRWWTARRNPVQIPASSGQCPVGIFTQDLSQTFFFPSKNKTKEQI